MTPNSDTEIDCAHSNAAWAVDDVVIYRLAENDACQQHVEHLLPELSLSTIRAQAPWLERDAFDPTTGILYRSYHSYVVQTPQHRVLVDTCIGNNKNLAHRPDWHGKQDTLWLDSLSATGLTPADIDYVLCTHLHVDHVGWNTSWRDGRWVPTFPNARHLIVAAEYASARDWPDRNPDDHNAGLFRASFQESVEPIMRAGQVDLVAADHTLGEYFRYQSAPGHTIGHSVIAVGRGRDVVVFTGDLFHSSVQTAFPDAIMPYDDDPALAANSRRAFLTRYSDTDTLVCSMHFPAPSVGHITAVGPRFRFVFDDV